MSYTVTTRDRGPNTVVEIRDIVSYNIRKVFNLAGKVLTPPQISGNDCIITMNDGSRRTLYKINMKTGSKVSKPL